MKRSLLAAFLIMLSHFAAATEAVFYVGTYTNHAKSKGIYMGRLDTQTGKLSPLTLAAETNMPTFLAASPDGKFLYACLETSQGSAAAFRVEPDAKLTELNKVRVFRWGALHIWMDATGQNVLVANWFDGVACVKIKPDGSLGEQTSSLAFAGSGPHPKYQTESHPHAVYTDADNRFAYVCDLGADKIWSLKFDANKGMLALTDQPPAKAPLGGGPRHLAIHPNGRFVYVCNQISCSVTAFARDAATGGLTPLQTLSTLPEGPIGKETDSAEIFCHPSGKWLYISNRGYYNRDNNNFAVYSIAPDGTLTWIENAPAQVNIPRGFAIDPTGQWLIAAGQNDDKIAVLKIDQASGKLTATDQFAQIGEPTCVLFAPTK